MDIETRLKQAEARFEELTKNESLTEEAADQQLTETIDNKLRMLKRSMPKELADLITEAENNQEVKMFQQSWFNIAVCYKVAKDQRDKKVISEYKKLEEILGVHLTDQAQFCYAMLTGYEFFNEKTSSVYFRLGWKLYNMSEEVDITVAMDQLAGIANEFTESTIKSMISHYEKAKPILEWYSDNLILETDPEEDTEE